MNPLIQMVLNAYPQQWQQAQRMFGNGNGNHDDKLKALRDLYKQKGMDLDATAKQYGIIL